MKKLLVLILCLIPSAVSAFNLAAKEEGKFDLATGAVLTTDYAHHEIHSGSSYTDVQITGNNDFDIAAPMSFLITTPNTTKWGHCVFSGNANTPAYWELFEDDDNATHFNVTGGTTSSNNNRNRNSAKTATVTIASGPTVTAATADVLIDSDMIGRAGGADRQEWILRQNTAYLFRATSHSDNNEGGLRISCYEHTDKYER